MEAAAGMNVLAMLGFHGPGFRVLELKTSPLELAQRKYRQTIGGSFHGPDARFAGL